MVSNDGVPAGFFSQSGAQMAMGEMARKVGVSLAKDNVPKYVMAAAQKLKERMKEELKDRFIHLKFECTTSIRTNYLGVNACFISSKDQAITLTLSILDSKIQLTAQDLKILLQKVLDQFEIPLSNVICCVKDNTSNMIRVVKDLNEDLAAASKREPVASGSGNVQ